MYYNNYHYNYNHYDRCNNCCFCGFIRCICNKIRNCFCPRYHRPICYKEDLNNHYEYYDYKVRGKREYCGGGNIDHGHRKYDCCEKRKSHDHVDADALYHAIRNGRYCAQTKRF